MPRTFKYIDKDRILPALNKRRRELIDSCTEEVGPDRRMDLLQIADDWEDYREYRDGDV